MKMTIISSSVINLDRRPDRMEYMKKLSEQLKIPMHKISAVDANDSKNCWLTEGKWSYLSGRSMTKGEHAVHASHHKTWIDAIDRGLDAVLILEDDVAISKDIKLILEGIQIPKDADIIKMEAHWGETEFGPVVGKVGENRNLRRMFSLHLGAAGYLVTRKGLKKLTEVISPYEIVDPLDWNLFDRRSKVFKMLTVYQIEPAPIVQIKFLQSAFDPNLVRSDLSQDRDKTEVGRISKSSLLNISKNFRKVILRIRSRLRRRYRLRVLYKK